jgi:DNA-binding GntR family transcriptional regulator
LTGSSTSIPTAPAGAPTGLARRAVVIRAILHALFVGQLKAGDRLVEEELALVLGVSRTPVREALGELASMRLISLRPNQGAVVRPFGEAQLRELYHIRRLLESEAARLAAHRLDPHTLSEMVDRMQHLLEAPPAVADSVQWSDEALQVDHDFHDLISEGSGSERLASEIARLRELADFLRETIGNTRGAQRVALTEHLEIADRLLARDGPGSAAAMAGHIQRGTETAVATLIEMAAQRDDTTPAVIMRGDRRRHRPTQSVHGAGAATT